MSISVIDTNQNYLMSVFKGPDYVVNLTNAIIEKLPPEHQDGLIINSRDDAFNFLTVIAGGVAFFFAAYFALHRIFEKMNV